MPKSKTFLPDVNVWLALASGRHIHTGICSDWLSSVDEEVVLFCRVSQMGLLRLLTNKAVMGSDVFTCREAWRTLGTILADDRITFAAEPFELETQWRNLTSQDRPTPKMWTDAYLSAFASAGGMQLVTLDKAILSISKDALLLK